MDTMTKKFKYKGYEFLITVEFNTMIERHPHGKIYHTVKAYCINANNWYYCNERVVDVMLEGQVILAEKEAKTWADKITTNSFLDPLKEKLIELGFSNE